MPVRVAYFANSASRFSARYFAALMEAPCELAAIVDVPASRRSTTNAVPDRLPHFVREARSQGVAIFEPASPNEGDFIQALRSLVPDLIIAAGYPLIFKEELIAMPRLLAANFHASLLPQYRGKHPVFWTLRAGERWAGMTVHAMDRGIDTGDILYQVKVRTRRNDSVASLYGRIMEHSVGLVDRLIADSEAGTVPRRPQPAGTGSYFSSITDDDYHLQWDWPAEKIRRYIAVTPGKCYVKIHDQRLFFHNAKVEPLGNTETAGTLLQVGRTRALVAAGQECVSSSKVHVADHKTESFAGFCRRLGLSPGSRLTS